MRGETRLDSIPRSSSQDRIINDFESDTPTAVLDRQKQSIIQRLPFPGIVPWDDLLVPLHYDPSRPIASVVESARAVTPEQLAAAAELTRRWKRDVLWHVEGSVAHLHLLKIAQERAQSQVAERLLSHMKSSVNNHRTNHCC